MERILVIDDSVAVSTLLSQTILPRYDYTVDVAFSGVEGIIQVRQRQPDLVLLDLELPDASGLHILRRIAEIDASLPVILMTAHGSEQTAVEAFRLGARNYLIKPFEEADVIAAIERALRERRLEHEKNRLTTHLQQRVRELSTLSAIGKSITGLLNIESLLERVVEAGVYLTRAEEGMLLLVDPGSTELYLRAAKNLGEDRVRRFRVPINDSLVGQVIRTRRPLRIGKTRDKGGLKIKTGYLAQAVLHVPILIGQSAIGVLGMSNTQSPRTFTEHDQWLLTSLADYASTALENARLFEAVTVEQQRYRDLFNDASDIIFTLDEQWKITSLNRRGQLVIGYNEQQAIGLSLDRLSHADYWNTTVASLSRLGVQGQDNASFDFVMIDKDGKQRFTEVNARVMSAGNRSYSVVCIARDVTERKAFEAQLRHLAFHDPLTHLPNRALFIERLEHALARSQRKRDHLAVLFLDLDNFKVINDSMGHEAGDTLLCAVARRLQRCVRPADTVARLGGDEFIVLLEDLHGDAGMARRVADRLQRELHEPVLIDGQRIVVTASIGIVTDITDQASPSDLVREADLAMYDAKAQGKAQAAIFQPGMNERAHERMRMELDLRRAVERNEFVVLYQPIIDLRSGAISEVEALVRWKHPERPQISPADFIPLAEETGLIIPLGMIVLEQACRQVGAWHRQFPLEPPLVLSVNLSPRQFQHPDLVSSIAGILARVGFDPNHLKLEITESVLLQDGEQTVAVMQSLRRLGVRLAIDDFGTGYCSLNYLKRFPVDTLKIDRSFITGLGHNAEDTAIVEAVITFAKALNLNVTGEGIETREQLLHLSELSCTRGQGYYFSRPLTTDGLSSVLEEQATRQSVIDDASDQPFDLSTL